MDEGKVEFHRAVLALVNGFPSGRVTTYGRIAEAIDHLRPANTSAWRPPVRQTPATIRVTV